MTDDGATVQPGSEEIAVPFRPRSEYAGYRAFGSGDGAVLVERGLTHELRRAAEFATQEGRIAGGLLYGRGWVDELGAYLVIDGYIEDGPGENAGDRIAPDGADHFTLSEAGLRLQRQEGARLYPASFEVGWWRTLPEVGEFGPADFETQAALVGPDGVGLLVYGSGVHWGTAYLGPDGDAPDSAGTLVVAAEPEPAAADADLEPGLDPGLDPGLTQDEGPALETEPGLEPEPGPEPEPAVVNLAAGESLLDPGPGPDHEVVDLGAGGSLLGEPLPDEESLAGVTAGAPAPASVRWSRGGGRGMRGGRAGRGGPTTPRRTRPRAASRASMPQRARAWAGAARPASAGGGGQGIPGDVQFVVGALAVVAVVAAIIIGVLVHSTVAALIIAAVALLVIFSTVWMSRHP